MWEINNVGGIATIYGTRLADGVLQASTTPLPKSLLGVKVLVNGVEAPLYFVAPGQINVNARVSVTFELTK